ncbi:MAG TPA: low affinity iron permease family protein [Longimicrobiaceae bacterium]|nr:low affinity iron permease family protein [Longimicrobiaceae bacterium]
MRNEFRKFASKTSDKMGTPWAFLSAVLIVGIWAVTGPMFHFSDTWQLVINTGTTIITFLMVFLIQNTQNRDARAMQLKLDELLRAVDSARTGLVDLEDLDDEEIKRLQEQFKQLRLHKANEKAEYADADRRGNGRRLDEKIGRFGP